MPLTVQMPTQRSERVPVGSSRLWAALNIPAELVQVRHEDFFSHNGKYTLIYDCTFLCAITPGRR